MGNQEPSVRIVPSSTESDLSDALKVLKLGKIQIDPWQETILGDWMSRNGQRWAAPTCGGSVPRQNGKSFLVQGRIEAGMLLFGEQVIYTAHLQKTATETFEEMRDYFEAPKLKKYVKDIKSAIGREQIILKNGGRVKFLARTRNGGRGQHGDLLVIDEAQEIDESAQASFLPAISASRNPQTIYIGTPPDPNTPGTVFRKIRQKALDGNAGKSAWFEFSVTEIGDVGDPLRWAQTNPALGRRIQLSTIEGELDQMDADTFARERLGWWASVIEKEVIDYALDHDAWARCASMEGKPEGKTAYGVKFSPDGTTVVLAGAVITPEGRSRISLIDVQPTAYGTRWLADWLNQRYEQASCVVIDGKNGADLLIDRITDIWKYKGSVVKPKANDVINACTLLTSGVNEGTLTWYKPQDALNDSAVNAVKRPIYGGWGFGGENSALIEACTLALWGAKNCRRVPGKKMRIG